MGVINSGVVKALLAEHERAINELIVVISDVSDSELCQIVDPKTKDEDCRSMQSILSHVVQSGYTYVIEVRRWLGEEVDYRDKVFLDSADAYMSALKKMLGYNEQLFLDHPNLTLESHDPIQKIKTRWGQLYDVEQLFEHAIVHILRHRRQIEWFKKSF